MKKKIFIIITLLMFAFMNKTFSKYEKIFFDLSIKSLEGNNIELSE